MSAYYRKRYKNKRFKIGKRFFVCIIFIALFFVFIFGKIKVDSIIVSVSKAQVDYITSNVVNNVIFQSNTANFDYNGLVDVQRNEQGDIVAITANSFKINYLTRKIAATVQNKLEIDFKKGVDVPIGAFTGIDAFAGLGPKISVKSLKISGVACEFDSEFKSVGINQTLHSIFAVLKINVNIVFSTKMQTVEKSEKLLVTESVMVGKVPDTYLGGNILSGN